MEQAKEQANKQTPCWGASLYTPQPHDASVKMANSFCEDGHTDILGRPKQNEGDLIRHTDNHQGNRNWTNQTQFRVNDVCAYDSISTLYCVSFG